MALSLVSLDLVIATAIVYQCDKNQLLQPRFTAVTASNNDLTGQRARSPPPPIP